MSSAPGTAIFLTSDPDVAPVALMHNLKHNKVLHEKNVILTVRTTDRPRVPENQRVTIEPISDDFKKLTISYGFMEQPDIPRLLDERHLEDWSIEHTTFFLGRETLLATKREGMAIWRERLFAFMSRNSQRASTFFNVPSDRVMEVGSQIEL